MFQLRRLLLSAAVLCQGIAMASSTVQKPITYEQIITLAKPQWVEVSPSADTLAFCTRRGNLEEDRNIDTLYFFDRQDGQQREVYAANRISFPVWKGDALYFLSQEGEEFKIVCLTSLGSTTLIESSDSIGFFALSPDGSRIYYSVTRMEPKAVIEKRFAEGYVYDWGRDLAWVLTEHKIKHKEGEDLCCFDVAEGITEVIGQLSYDNWSDYHGSRVNCLTVSDDGKKLLLTLERFGSPALGETGFTKEVVLWDLVSGVRVVPFSESTDVKEAPCWLDNTTFLFGRLRTDTPRWTQTLWVMNADTMEGSALDWLDIGAHVIRLHWNKATERLYAFSCTSLYEIDLRNQHVEQFDLPPHLSEMPSLDGQGRYLGYILQDSNEAPEIAVRDLSSGAVTCVTYLNPQLEDVALGHVEKLRIESPSGVSAVGYLVHPVDEQPDQRYPLIVASYGFDGLFITDAEWHSSFPAQTLAGEGYAVLLLNCPWGAGQNSLGQHEGVRQAVGWNTLELFEAAVDQLIERGLADPDRVGIYGWSHGGFVAEFLIAHSDKFHVACIGEGGDYNPGGYWMGGASLWPSIYENTFGGPPWGATLENYLGFSPVFHVDKIRTPLLMEFSEFAIGGLEMYVPLRCTAVPAELVVYPLEEHNFVRPKARAASMARKVEWFNYWFFGRRSDGPDKEEQYARWDEMRVEAIKHDKLPSPLVDLGSSEVILENGQRIGRRVSPPI